MARPLTKKDQDGAIYKRPPKIESAIDEAVQQDIATLRRRAVMSRSDSPDFMPLECLVHIIRHFWRRREEERMSLLLPLLLARCEAILKKTMPDSSRPNAADIREEILSDFSLLFAEDDANPDELDFFECRFNRAFRCFRIDYLRREAARSKQLRQLPLETEITESSFEEERLTRVPDALQSPDRQIPDVFAKELLDAIEALPPDERRAVVLCHILGYKEESDDPSERTAASICGVTGRTIRNRLMKAAKNLSKFDMEVER